MPTYSYWGKTPEQRFGRKKLFKETMAAHGVAPLADFAATGPAPPYRPKSAHPALQNGIRRAKGFLCFEIKCDVLDNHRQFYPLDSTAREFLASIDDKNYVLLRGENEIDDLPTGADIDLLIESGDIGEIIARNEKKLCTRPVDIYSHDGSNGFYFNRAPYVTPKLAEALLSEKVLKNGIYIAAPEAQFLSDQFHTVFHQRRSIPKGSEIIKKQDLRSASTFRTPGNGSPKSRPTYAANIFGD